MEYRIRREVRIVEVEVFLTYHDLGIRSPAGICESPVCDAVLVLHPIEMNNICFRNNLERINLLIASRYLRAGLKIIDIIIVECTGINCRTSRSLDCDCDFLSKCYLSARQIFCYRAALISFSTILLRQSCFTRRISYLNRISIQTDAGSDCRLACNGQYPVFAGECPTFLAIGIRNLQCNRIVGVFNPTTVLNLDIIQKPYCKIIVSFRSNSDYQRPATSSIQ